jgi:hypothetical protein
MQDKPRCVENDLYRNNIDYKLIQPVTEDEKYLFGLVEHSGSILQDYQFTPEYRTLKAEAEYRFSMSPEIKHFYTTFDSNKGKLVLIDDRDKIFRQLREAFMNFVYWKYYSVEEGLPLFIKSGKNYIEIPGRPEHREYMDLFAGRHHQDDDFQVDGFLSSQVNPLLDKLYFSEYQERVRQIFFSQYESGGTKEFEIRQRAFRLYLDGKLFSDSPSLSARKNVDVLDTRSEDGLLMTIGLLARVLSSKSGNTYVNGDRISASAITKDILQEAPLVRGLGESSVRKRISDGLSRLKDSLPEAD